MFSKEKKQVKLQNVHLFGKSNVIHLFISFSYAKQQPAFSCCFDVMNSEIENFGLICIHSCTFIAASLPLLVKLVVFFVMAVTAIYKYWYRIQIQYFKEKGKKCSTCVIKWLFSCFLNCSTSSGLGCYCNFKYQYRFQIQ